MDEIIWSDYKRLTCTLWIVVYVVGGPHNKAQKGSRKIGLSINTHRRRTDEIGRLFFVPVQSFQLLLTHSCALLPFMLLLLSLVFFSCMYYNFALERLIYNECAKLELNRMCILLYTRRAQK